MRRGSRTGIGAVTMGAAVIMLAGTASAAPAPGAPGAGDPSFPSYGNGGYDVDHYDVRLTYQPETDHLDGTATILANTTQELSSFNLDFALNVKSVRVNNVPAEFAKDANDATELVVTPAEPLAAQQPITVVVEYDGVPSETKVDGYSAWRKTADGAVVVGQPEASEWWFPGNDHPSDKATYDVSVEVPDAVSALSNGTLVKKTKQREGWTRWNWRSTQPQATYLATLAVGALETHEALAPNGQPFVTGYDPAIGESLPAAKASVERTPEINSALEKAFGPYPFEAQGGIVSPALNFALETQTRPVYSQKFFANGANTSVVVHENAHQWFGDSVSVRNWRDIWLNEGFASYAELLWSEYNGEGTADELAEYLYNSYPAEDEFWQVPPADPGAADPFHDAVYDRGAMTVHALRKAVGDQAFFTILQTWQDAKKGGNATVEEFIAHAEQVAGKPLTEIVDTWLTSKGKPAVSPNGTPARAASATAPRTAAGELVEPKSLPAIRATHELLAESNHGHEHAHG